jgi:hypothetical protein
MNAYECCILARDGQFVTSVVPGRKDLAQLCLSRMAMAISGDQYGANSSIRMLASFSSLHQSTSS